MTIKQLSVFVENKPGRLVEITDALGSAGIDIRALSIADTQDFGILRMIVSDTDRAVDALKKANCVVSITCVIAICIPDEPGSFSKVLRLLSDNGISVEYTYAFITKKSENAYVVFRVADNDKAISLLSENGIITASSDVINNL